MCSISWSSRPTWIGPCRSKKHLPGPYPAVRIRARADTMTNKLIGQNYVTPDLAAKVTGRAKYAEDFRVDGMLFCKLLLSPVPHGRVVRIDTSRALATPGVKGILTADELPAPADVVTDLGQRIPANTKGERALTNEPLYQGEPILALAAVDELTG